MKELAAIVMSEISKVTDPANIRGGIVLVGGGAQMPDIDELFQRTIDMDTRIGLPKADSSNPNIADEIKDPSFATAIGLVQVYFDQLNDAEEEKLAMAQEEQISGNNTKSGGSKPPGIKSIFNRMVDTLMGGNEDAGEYDT
jgi:cell division protein FtsA